MAVMPAPTYDEVYDFLLNGPTPQEILAFRPSEATQERIRALLEANQAGTISAEGQRELEEFSQVEHFVRMLKIRAQRKLDAA